MRPNTPTMIEHMTCWPLKRKLNLMQSHEPSEFTDEDTVAQRREVTCQSHTSSVRMGLRPCCPTATTSCLPWGSELRSAPLGSQTAVFRSGPDKCVCSTFIGLPSRSPHPLHDGRRRKQQGGRESSSGPAFFLPGPVHTLHRKVSPLL